MKQKVGIIDIAKKTGYSLTTVSRVLSGNAKKYRISKKAEQLIRQLADELDYIPNESARNLRTGKSKTIALILPSLKNPFFAEIASVVNAEVKKYNYITFIGDTDDDIDTEKSEVLQFISKNTDGLIIVPCGEEFDHLIKAQNDGLPLICIDRYFEDQELSFVSSDNFEGAYSATKYLVQQGHKNIACIQGVRHSEPNRQRVKGFLSALSESGISAYSVSGDDFSEQNGYIEAKLLLQTKDRPSAVFALSNTIAMGCLKAFKEENIKIPDDISLITFDENPYLNYIEPPLTCISQPLVDICKIAVKILFSKILDQEDMAKKILLKTTLRIKKSVKNI